MPMHYPPLSDGTYRYGDPPRPLPSPVPGPDTTPGPHPAPGPGGAPVPALAPGQSSGPPPEPPREQPRSRGTIVAAAIGAGGGQRGPRWRTLCATMGKGPTMKALITAALMTAALAAPAAAFDPAAMTEAEKTAFGEAVRDYIMENPQVLIEAVNRMEEQRLADEARNDKLLVEANKAAIFEDGHSWVGGNPQGDLTMVEFIDYRCGYCRKVAPEVDALVKQDGNIRLILKEFPILGQESELASRYAIAVRQIAGPDAYKTAHDRLYDLRGAVTLESLSALAKDQGLDAAAIVARMNTEEVSAEIRANRQLAEKMQVMGTPTFVIGPELLRGIPSTGLAGAVAQIRQAAKG